MLCKKMIILQSISGGGDASLRRIKDTIVLIFAKPMDNDEAAFGHPQTKTTCMQIISKINFFYHQLLLIIVAQVAASAVSW